MHTVIIVDKWAKKRLVESEGERETDGSEKRVMGREKGTGTNHPD